MDDCRNEETNALFSALRVGMFSVLAKGVYRIFSWGGPSKFCGVIAMTEIVSRLKNPCFPYVHHSEFYACEEH